MEKDKINSVRFHTMAIILIIIFAAAITPVTFQNDTYYTIKVGEYILENGITMQEPFAWHENLTYTFPHWAYDVFIYLIYSIGGMTGIYISTIILASILGITMYAVNVKLAKNKIISFVLTILTMYLLKSYICARAQLVTFILFILTIYFIERFLETKKKRYAIGLIIIPILIANLHAATFYFYFILYLPYIAEYGIYILAYSNVIISNSYLESIKRKIKKQGETEELLQKMVEETCVQLQEKNVFTIVEAQNNRANEKRGEDRNDKNSFIRDLLRIWLLKEFFKRPSHRPPRPPMRPPYPGENRPPIMQREGKYPLY